MIYTLQAPSVLRGDIRLPASKSISNRVLILNALSQSPYPIENLSDSDDTAVLAQALQSPAPLLDVGAAGTSMRFLTAYRAQWGDDCTLTGSERMKNRPIGRLVDALRQCGASIEYVEKEGFPPLRIRGKRLRGGAVALAGDVSSQYVSALLMVAPCMEAGLRLRLEGRVISQPYIRMTLGLMEAFGIRTCWEGALITVDPQPYVPRPFRVESDWSAASYWYEIRALAPKDSRIEWTGLDANSLQGDAKVDGLFEELRRHTGVFQYDFIHEPDLAQTLAVTCCLSDIPFRFTGLQSLRIKETDRLVALQTELRKLGYRLRIDSGNGLEWTGERCAADPHPVIATYEDHRMAMSFAPACLKTGEIRIADPGVVSKSYPRYWDDLRAAGFILTEQL
jgi:3-phosphoshikimate 1-carboxyvinyltransferase